MSSQEKRLCNTNAKVSHWNSKRILQKIANIRKSQKNKSTNSENLKRQGQSIFRSIVIATRATYRAPRLVSINLESDKKPASTSKEMLNGVLNTNILQGNIKEKKEIQVNIPSVNAMCTSEKNSIWIGCWNRTPISHLICEEHIKTKETFDTPVSDMTVTSSGDILFTKFGDCSIKHLSLTDGSITTFRGCAPLFPEGIHTTKSGDILVTVVDETSFLVNKSTKRKVLKMTNTGKLLKEIEYGSRGLKLFILPYRVTENINGDICVVNRTGRYLGQIVVLDSDGNLKFTYDGNPSLPGIDFIPMGIACDNNGCIIITDPNDFSIHILDKNGCLIQYFLSTEIGISTPLSVCVDQKGSLWVGCFGERRKGETTAKVYALC